MSKAYLLGKIYRGERVQEESNKNVAGVTVDTIVVGMIAANFDISVAVAVSMVGSVVAVVAVDFGVHTSFCMLWFRPR